jgi:DNA-directed RNA polymerase beta subunit
MEFDNAKELLEYVQEAREDWILQEETLTFQPPATSGAQDIPSMECIQRSLTYATEMERKERVITTRNTEYQYSEILGIGLQSVSMIHFYCSVGEWWLGIVVVL